MKKELFKLEFIKKYSDHESQIRTIYSDDFEVVTGETGNKFYVCKFSSGQQLTLLADQFDDYHVVLLYREEKSPE